MITLRKLRLTVRNTLKSARDIWRGKEAAAFRRRLANAPLLRAEKTYNTSHPDYERSEVRNFPGRILNPNLPCDNPLFHEIKGLAFGDRVPTFAWRPVLRRAMAEAATVPGFAHIMEGRAFIERYAKEKGRLYQAQYNPGWVNLTDAQFLYW